MPRVALANGLLPVLLGALVLACGGAGGRSTKASPAPAFHSIPDDQLESAMWRLAAGVHEINAFFGGGQPVKDSQRPELLRVLDEMIAAANELGPEGVATNHSRITHNLGRFREKLEIARSAVEQTPPRYYLVGNIAGTCLACHKSESPRSRQTSSVPSLEILETATGGDQIPKSSFSMVRTSAHAARKS